MKKLLQILTVFVLINTSLVIFSEKAEAQSVSFQVFYDDLSPYGSWYESPEHGYVWRPSLSGFTPYSTNGYWVLTNYGWTWVSDYSWGWAPFHYGRWYYDQLYGYVWVPGYEWGPGWVTWRRSDNYYGWAPIGPGVSMNIAYSNGYNLPYNHWNFVRCSDFGRRDIHNYYIDRSKNVTIINNTTVINTTRVDNARRTTFTPGPDRSEVQRKVGKPINPVAVVDENKPTQRVTKNSVQLYRPIVESKNVASAMPAPKKVIQRNEAKQQQASEVIERADNKAMDDRRLKQPQPAADKQPANQQAIKQNKDRTDQQQRPEKKPVRDEQTTPVKQPPVEIQDKTDAQREREQPIHKQRDEQPRQPERIQRKEQPQALPQPERVQRKEQAPPSQPERPQRTEQPPVPQPDRPQRIEQRPVPQQPERQQKAMPQQNMDRPAPVQREQQAPRQAPVQRPPATQKERKG